jgi:3-hydroxy acid dehydrogenase/malonic semialdehyde reductase
MAGDLDHAAPRMAVVTGASSGIGKGTALQLAAQGWQVAALGRREAAPPEFARLGAVRYGAGDLALEDPAQVLQRVAPDALDCVAALVHCAGHDLGGGKPFHAHAADEWASGLRLSVEAMMRLTHACLPAMLARGAGDVVIIGSITSRRAAPGLAAYSTGKHAQRGFAQALRADYADSGLRITEIAPGVVRSGFAGHRLHGDTAQAEAFYEGFAQYLEPEDVARAICFALSQPAHVSVAEMVLLPTRERR